MDVSESRTSRRSLLQLAPKAGGTDQLAFGEEQVLPHTWFDTRMGARPRIDRLYLAIGSPNPNGPASYGVGR